MKIFYFLFVILIVFTVAVRAIEDTEDEHMMDFYDKDLTCEKLFKVSSCSDCQELIFHDIKQDENDCSASFNLIKEVIKEIKDSGKEKIDPYDITYFKKGLENYCDLPFNCDPHTAEKYWTKIEDVCADELNHKVDWNSDPRKMDRNTILVFGTLFSYYFGIPTNYAYCHKSSDSDEFCIVKTTENILEYAKKATDEDPKPSFSFDFKYVYKKDGTRIPIPKKLFCGEKCVNSIIKTYKSWIKHYKLSPKVIENVFGSEDEFDDYLDCKTDDKRDTRTSGSCLSPLHSSFFYN